MPPSIRWTSDRQIPQASTRTSTSRGPGSGTGTSSIVSARVEEWNRAARIVSIG
jgi:hypothetical protein